MSPNPISCLLVDDEPNAGMLLEDLLASYPEINVVGKTDSPHEALSLALKLKPDVLFLDIEMPGMDGFSLLKEIHFNGLKPVVVFTTAYKEYTIQAIRHAAFDYLLKPLDRDELDQVIQRLVLHRNQADFGEKLNKLVDLLKAPAKVRVTTRKGTCFLDPDSVAYLEAKGNTTLLYGAECPVVSTQNLGKLVPFFSDNGFLRIGRSLIINRQYVTFIDRKSKTCELTRNGQVFRITIPRNYFEMIEKAMGKTVKSDW